MKMKVFEAGQEKNEVARFRLVEKNGRIVLVAVNEKGKELSDGCILCIDDKGSLYLYSSINEDLGLNLDGKGRLRNTQ